MTDYSKCKLTRFPTPVLEQRAEAIAEINDDIRRLADRMIKTQSYPNRLFKGY